MRNVFETFFNVIQKRRPLIIILLLSCFLLFFRLGRADSLNDGSHYSLRAIGYIDYISPKNQTSPIEWYDYIPTWSKLSFHDAPPLVFFIQHIFFKFFGVNVVVMRLPFALAGLLSVYFLFLLARELYDEKIAYVSAGVLAISTFFIWTSRTSFLEGIEVFFIIATLYVFALAMKDDRYFIWFGVLLGLAFLTKYTTFFLLPFVVAYIFIKDKKIFFKKNFLAGILLFVIIFSPVIIYNVMVFKTRGHFDVQFSRLFPSMFEAAKKDWPVLYKEKPAAPNIIKEFFNIWPALKSAYSPPFYYLIIFSLLFASISLFFRRRGGVYFFSPLAFAFAAILISFVSSQARYLPILAPFLSVFIGVTFITLAKNLKNRGALYAFYSLFGVVVFIEFFFNVNTNLISHDPNVKSPYYSEIRENNLGFNQLDKYLRATLINEPFYSKDIIKVKQFHDVKLSWDEVAGKNLYIFDMDLLWFGKIWYFNKYVTYRHVFFIGDTEFQSELGRSKIAEENLVRATRKMGVKNVFYIVGANDSVYENGYKGKTEKRKNMEILESQFKTFIEDNKKLNTFIEDKNIGEVTTIYNDLGKEAFRVYRIKVNG